MQRVPVICAVAFILAAPSAAPAQNSENSGPWHVMKTAKVGGEGGFDYVNVDVDGRRLYIARRGNGARVTVFDLDSLQQVGELANTNAHGAVVDMKTSHGFASSTPVLMFD